MLDGNAHALTLNTVHLGGSHFPRKVRVFGKVFKAASRRRVALNIRAGAEHYVDAVFVRFLPDSSSYSV